MKLEDVVYFYLVDAESDRYPLHKGAIMIPGEDVHLEIWQAPKSKKWHWMLQFHKMTTYYEDPGEGFLSAREAMQAALDQGEATTTIATSMDGERLMDIVEWAQEERERNKTRGL